MTILIGFVTKQDIVLTADGRSNLVDNTGRRTQFESLQKIFPSKNGSITICHHGENVIQGKAIGDHLSEFFEHTGHVSVVEVKNALQAHFDSIVKTTLCESEHRKGCGFWIAGRTLLNPVIHEIFWKRNEQTGSISFEQKEFRKCFVLGGDGAATISEFKENAIDSKFSPNKVRNAKLAYAIAYSDKLYELATSRSEACGGHKHQYLVRQKRWTIGLMDFQQATL